MRRALAILALAAALAGSLAALVAPLPGAAALAVVAVAASPGKKLLLGMAAVAAAIQVPLLAILAPGTGATWTIGPATVGVDGALAALAVVGRMTGAIACNTAIIGRFGPAALIDDLRLPPKATAYLAAVLLAARDLATDFEQMTQARRMAVGAPRTRFHGARDAAGLLPPLVARSMQRANARREALQLAGIHVGPNFAPIVAVAALAAAGRLAFVAIPNVALTYVIVFSCGYALGPRVAALGAALGMIVTDVLLTGFLPTGFVNVPAMAVVGAAGGAMARVPLDGAAGRATATVLAACLGIASTLAFSVAADTGTWLLVPEIRGAPGAWQALVLAGLAFNAIPALVNAVLFAAAWAPLAAAMGQFGGVGPQRAVPQQR